MIILNVCITPKFDIHNVVAAVENYKLAGFKTPKLLIIDQSLDCIEALEKIDFKPKQV